MIRSAFGPVRLTILVGLFLCGQTGLAVDARAGEGQESTQAKPSSSEESVVWAISLAWQDDTQLVFTASSGLHFRPGSVTRLDISTGDTADVGQTDCSLWGLTRVDNGKFLACDYRGNLYVIGDSVQKLPLSLTWSRAIASLGDSKAAIGTQDGKVVIVDLTTAKTISEAELHSAQVFSIWHDVDAGKLISSDASGKVVCANAETLEEEGALEIAGGSVWTAFASGDHVIAGGASRRIEVIARDLSSKQLSANKSTNWISASALVPDSSLVLLATMEGDVIVFDSKTLHRVSTTRVAESGIWDAKVSPNGKKLALATRKHGVRVVDVAPLIENASDVAAVAEKLAPPKPNGE